MLWDFQQKTFSALDWDSNGATFKIPSAVEYHTIMCSARDDNKKIKWKTNQCMSRGVF